MQDKVLQLVEGLEMDYNKRQILNEKWIIVDQAIDLGALFGS